MRRYRSIFLLPALLAGASLAGVAKNYPSEVDVSAVIIFAILLAIAPAWFMHAQSPRFAYFHLSTGIVVMAMAASIAWTSEDIFYIERDSFGLAFLVFSGVLCLSFIVAVPAYLLPYFRRGIRVSKKAHQKPPDAGFVDASLDRIKAAFAGINDAVNRESANLDKSMEIFAAEFRAQEASLREVRQQLSDLKNEVDEYRELASLTRSQRDAVLAALQRGKYIDYLVGFLLGALSSALVAWLGSLSPTFSGG